MKEGWKERRKKSRRGGKRMLTGMQKKKISQN